MSLKISTLRTLFRLYKDYNETSELSAAEYLKEAKKKTSLSDPEVQIFLELIKNQQFLGTLAENILQTLFFKRVNKSIAEVVLFLIVFVLDDANLKTILQFCIQIKCFYLCELITVIADSNKHILICKAACKYFDNDYVLEKIIDPLLNKIPITLNLGKEYLKLHEVKVTPNTEPKVFEFMKHFYKRHFYPPANTPACPRTFRAAPVPKSTWHKQISTDQRIMLLKEQNREKAKQLLLEASQVPERLTQRPNKVENNTDEIFTEIFKRKPIPHFKKVEIKGNITTTLREASRITRSQEEDLKQIDALMKGSYSKENIEKIEEQLKKENELRELEMIEQKHLKGLLSYEESILAKKKLLEINKQKMEQFKEEKIKLLQALQHWREEEEEKIKSLVEKSHIIRSNAKDSEKKLLEKKQQNVQLQQYETKQMLEHALAEKNKELARKVELIQEIKALYQVRCNIKEFDPTETPNLGLLCEMSIAELQERLVISKVKMNQELEEKRQGILKRKEQHKIMIDNVKKIISESRLKKSKKLPQVTTQDDVNNSTKLQQNPEIIELRRRLEEKRQLRCKF